MALNYELPDHLTNGKLDADGYGPDLFGFLTVMMVTKVGDLKGKNKDTFIERAAQYEVVADNRGSLWRVVQMADYLEGMGTNIQTESDAAWKRHLYTLTKERGTRLLYEAKKKAQVEAH